MGLIPSNTQQYYQGNNFGNYQFTSLEDIINQFIISYVGENKIIPKINKLDVAYFAQRALQELSFDVFKSCKSQEITLPASLQMILPHDYVNYTRVMWVDSSGIKHPLYPTRDTQNPFNITQDDEGNYVFESNYELGTNMDFSRALQAPEWNASPAYSVKYKKGGTKTVTDTIGVVSGALTFVQHVYQSYDHNQSSVYSVWQEIDVTGMNAIELTATGTAQAVATNIVGGTIRCGITGVNPNSYNPPSNYNKYTPPVNTGPVSPGTGAFTNPYDGSTSTSPNQINAPSIITSGQATPYLSTLNGNPAYLEWENGDSSTETLNDNEAIDVTGFNKVYVVVTCVSTFTTDASTLGTVLEDLNATNTIDDIIIVNPAGAAILSSGTGNSSITWNNYSSSTPSINSDDYEDDTYWPMMGGRYGLDPQHAQSNGSFFIDCSRGLIHFSSNVSGKTVVLDYISDSLGTNEEMQVHKFAEEAMYKWIAHAIISTSSYGQALAPRFKKEKFAAVRQAKLRLSNIKLEEITQIFRGKSKQIKH